MLRHNSYISESCDFSVKKEWLVRWCMYSAVATPTKALGRFSGGDAVKCSVCSRISAVSYLCAYFTQIKMNVMLRTHVMQEHTSILGETEGWSSSMCSSFAYHIHVDKPECCVVYERDVRTHRVHQMQVRMRLDECRG